MSRVRVGAESQDTCGPTEPALVCFTGRTEIPWLRLLRSGFRHCFCLLPVEPGTWLLIDPRCNRLDVRPVVGQSRENLHRHFRRAGYRVVATDPGPAEPPRGPLWLALLPMPYTCVEAVKRALGLQTPWILTPYALYRRLRKNTGDGKLVLTLCSRPGIHTFERATRAPAARPAARQGERS